MVTVGPPKYNVGTQIGNALGQGLQQGIGQGLNRGMLQKTLGKVKDLTNQTQIDPKTGKEVPKPTDPIELMLGVMQAGAGIPGSERYLSTLLPILLQKARTEDLYGGNKGGGMGNGEGPMSPPDASKAARKFIEGEQPSGFLSSPMTPDQVQQYATEYANRIGTPEAFDQGLQQARNINSERLQSRQILQSAATSQGIEAKEMPRFMQYATEAQDLNDLPAIERFAVDKTLQLRNLKDALQNVDAPGAYQKLGGWKQHIAPGMTLYKALTNRGDARRKALKGYEELVRDVVNEGEEPFVRKTLADKGISNSEIEELIHPLTDSMAKNIEKLPKGNQLNPKARLDSLVNFFRSNVDNNTSLSVLRNYLVENKNYDWEEIRDAVKLAFPEGERLNKYQSAESSTLAKPPIQSLSQIFSSQPNIRGFLRGQR